MVRPYLKVTKVARTPGLKKAGEKLRLLTFEKMPQPSVCG